jgi:membrane protein
VTKSGKLDRPAVGEPSERPTGPVEPVDAAGNRGVSGADSGGGNGGGVGNGGGTAATSPADYPTVAIQPVDPDRPDDPALPDEAGATKAGAGSPQVAIHYDRERRMAWHGAATGPIPVAPGGSVGHRWRKITGRALSKAWNDSLFGLSSQAAFWCALSTAPLLLALLGLVSYVAPWFGPDTIQQIYLQIISFLHGIFNAEVADNLVGNTVKAILFEQRGDVVSVGLLISLWAGSSAMSAFVESITVAYGQHEVRHPVTERFFALGLYLIALVAGIFLLPLLAIGPELLPKLFPMDWRDQVATIVGWLYYPVLTIGLIVLLTTLYQVAPKRKHPWRRGLPGALVAALVFLVASFGLRLYLSYVYSHGLTYGALATPITFLLFYYFVSMAIVIGAQFNNATLEYYPPKRSKRAMRKWRRLKAEDMAVAQGGAAADQQTDAASAGSSG